MEKNIICPYIKKCGACDWLSVDYNKQLQDKKSNVNKLLKGMIQIDDIIGMKHPFYYRNKITRIYGLDNKKHFCSGIYEVGGRRLVEIESCFIEDRKAGAILETLDRLFKSFKMRAYDEKTGYGLIRYVQIRVGHSTGEIMVTIVTASPIFPSKLNFCKALLKEHPEITTVVQNVNVRTDNLVLSDKENVLYGKGFINDVLCDKTFKISSKSFYQVNSAQTEILYSKAIELAALSRNDVVLDAYCGIGTIGIIASAKAKKVLAVESNKDAVKDALVNAKINKCDNVYFYNEDAGSYMQKVANDNRHVDVVFMDPPRSGASPEFIKAVVLLNPDKVVYVSCNPETLTRDLKQFVQSGYVAKKALCVDMFPHTRHVETIALLSRETSRPAKDYVKVGIDAEEYYRIKEDK